MRVLGSPLGLQRGFCALSDRRMGILCPATNAVYHGLTYMTIFQAMHRDGFLAGLAGDSGAEHRSAWWDVRLTVHLLLSRNFAFVPPVFAPLATLLARRVRGVPSSRRSSRAEKLQL